MKIQRRKGDHGPLLTRVEVLVDKPEAVGEDTPPPRREYAFHAATPDGKMVELIRFIPDEQGTAWEVQYPTQGH